MGRTILLLAFLAAAIGVIIATWGSIGSAVLTIALVPGVTYALLKRFFDTHDPEDYRSED